MGSHVPLLTAWLSEYRPDWAAERKSGFQWTVSEGAGVKLELN